MDIAQVKFLSVFEIKTKKRNILLNWHLLVIYPCQPTWTLHLVLYMYRCPVMVRRHWKTVITFSFLISEQYCPGVGFSVIKKSASIQRLKSTLVTSGRE